MKENSEEYTINDELDFIAMIASNGTVDHNGMIKSDEEVEESGVPSKPRTCIERIQFLESYGYQWDSRSLPGGWSESDRSYIKSYIRHIAIPTIKSLREIQLGDLV